MAERLLGKLTSQREGSSEDRLAIILIAIGVAIVVGSLIAVDDRGPAQRRLPFGAANSRLLPSPSCWLRSRFSSHCSAARLRKAVLRGSRFATLMMLNGV